MQNPINIILSVYKIKLKTITASTGLKMLMTDWNLFGCQLMLLLSLVLIHTLIVVGVDDKHDDDDDDDDGDQI